MTNVAETSTFTRYSAPQWRILQALHWAERRTTPVKGARGLLTRQEASVEDLLDLSRAGLVEGVVPGAVLDLTQVNWAIKRRGSDVIQCRITSTGNRAMQAPMLLFCIGRGRRYTIRDVGRMAGLDDVSGRLVSGTLAETLRAAEQLGLIRAGGDDGQSHDLSRYTEIPATLRLSLTRRGGTYLARKER